MNVLVIAAHPDDEILGIGGTAIKHVKEGDKVYCLILGEGVTSRESFSEESLQTLHKQTVAAAKIIGYHQVILQKLPDQKFDTAPLLDIVKGIEKCLKTIKPDLVYTHCPEDLNLDHQITFQAVLTASRPCNECAPKEIRVFETLSSTEWQSKSKNNFNPNLYININQEIELKIKALEEYSSELREYPHPRSIEGVKILAQFRGLEVGKKYAEAFSIIRKIKD